LRIDVLERFNHSALVASPVVVDDLEAHELASWRDARKRFLDAPVDALVRDVRESCNQSGHMRAVTLTIEERLVGQCHVVHGGGSERVVGGREGNGKIAVMKRGRQLEVLVANEVGMGAVNAAA